MIRYFLILLFFILVSCGYNPIFSDKTIKLKIDEISTQNENKIYFKVKRYLEKFEDEENTTNQNLKIEVDASEIINSTSKDSKGNPKTYELNVIINLKVFKNNVFLSSKNFQKSFNYAKNSNKFNQRQYEKNLVNNLTNEILQDMIGYLITI